MPHHNKITRFLQPRPFVLHMFCSCSFDKFNKTSKQYNTVHNNQARINLHITIFHIKLLGTIKGKNLKKFKKNKLQLKIYDFFMYFVNLAINNFE